MFHPIFPFQVLSLKYNQGPILIHDKAFRGLSLKTLMITYCGIEHPPALAYIKHSIRVLRLSHNAINFLSNQYFEGCLTLEHVSLHSNMLSFIPNLHHISRTIQSISLSTNNITDGKRLYDCYFPKLNKIWIEYCSIRTFCMPHREMWPEMRVMDLSYNNITSFCLPPWGDFLVQLKGNPIHCDDGMGWVRRCDLVPPEYDTLHCSLGDYIYGLTCYSPDSVAGLSPLDTGRDLMFFYKWKTRLLGQK